MIPRGLARWLERRTGALFRARTEARVVALTLDDTPSPATPSILSVLESFDVRATFFVIGRRARRWPSLLEAIHDAGHELANHFFTERMTLSLSEAERREELVCTARLLDVYRSVPFARPGSGWLTPAMVRQMEALGYRVVLGSIYPFDPVVPFPRLVARWVLAAAHPGGIVILHDGERRGQRTAEALSEILPALEERGYGVVGLSEVMGGATFG